MNKTYPWTRTYTFAGFHRTRNVDCFNSLLWFCFVWTAVEKTLRLSMISTCTDPVLALNFPLHLSVSRIKTASQLLYLQENTEVLASVNEQNMTGKLTDAEKYLTFRLLRSLSGFSSPAAWWLEHNERACSEKHKRRFHLSSASESNNQQIGWCSLPRSVKCSEHIAECSVCSK